MKRSPLIRSCLATAILATLLAGCENHPIPNKEETGGTPAETYDSAPFSGDVEPSPEVGAEFPGGRHAMIRFLAEHIQYPQTAIDLGIEGKCYLQFVVGKDGYVRDVHVVRGVPDCPECDKEAVRVIKSMPRWMPGRMHNKAVHSTFNLPITFKLQ